MADTQGSATPTPATQTRVRRSGFLHPTTLAALLVAAVVCAGVWMAANRPVWMQDAPGRIAGLAFSPFQRGQGPEEGSFPSLAEICRDLEVAAGISDRVRTYTVQGDMAEIPRLAAQAGLGLRITLGAWLARDAMANGREMSRLIAASAHGRNVERVIVGNETILRGDLSVPALIGYLGQARAAVRVPVSTAEPWHVWLAHPELAAAVDVITIHLLPYWEGIPVGDAERFLLEKLAAVRAAFPGKPIVIGEVGWPSDGVSIGAARASRVNQAMFLRRFFGDAQRMGLDYFVMEAFDQPWKTNFEGRAAGYWGLLDLDRAVKWPLVGPVTETPNWAGWAGISAVVAAVLGGALLSRRPDIALRGKLAFALLVQGFVASLACVLLAMSEKYLTLGAGAVWAILAAGQGVLLLLLLADGFELAETLWGGAAARPEPKRVAGSRQPRVSIHLAICNEPPHMLRQTLNALAALDYPNFEVLVIDNNTTDPALWEPVAEHCARLGARFRFFTLGAWPGYKAGALNFALSKTAHDAEIVAVLDSDYIVSPDWLACMTPYFADPKMGFVQSPQDYRDASAGLFKRLMFWEYAGFFRLGMVTRDRRNAIIQHGTMTLIRRSALQGVAVDGQAWAEWCICEDAELGLRLFRGGWRSVYHPKSFGRGVMPDDFCGLRKQRHRWAYGAMQICRRHARALFSPWDHSLSLGQRWHFVTGWLPWVGDALGLLFLALGLVWSVALIAAPARFEFPIVLFMLPAVFLFGFKLAQIFLLYRNSVGCGAADRLGAAVTGLALSHTIAKAVWKGLFVRNAPFLRTPKLSEAPMAVQGLRMAASECVLLALTWAAMIGVGVTHRLATPEVRLWCLILFTQSLPYLAAIFISMAAALPARLQAPVVRAAPARGWSQDAAGD